MMKSVLAVEDMAGIDTVKYHTLLRTVVAAVETFTLSASCLSNTLALLSRDATQCCLG